MVLCKKCAHTVHATTSRCPRCHLSWPYFRSRRWRRRAAASPLSVGKGCPRCGRRTSRRRTPAWLKPFRALLGDRVSWRRCEGCTWRGPAFHGTGARPVRGLPEREPAGA